MTELQFNNEISQADNPNATTKLWIQPDGTIFKQYVVFNFTTKKNIHNLSRLVKLKHLHHIEALVLPSRIVQRNNQILGYVMPFCSGITLGNAIEKGLVSDNALLTAFVELARVILSLPKNVAIGDLHAKNILVETNGHIHLIDIDGFTLLPKYRQTCPLIHRAEKDNFPKMLKYYFVSGKFRVGHQSDIFCFFLLFFRWIMGDISFLSYTKQEFFAYLKYLREVGFPTDILKMVFRLYSHKPNYIDISALLKLDVSVLGKFRYQQYLVHNISGF